MGESYTESRLREALERAGGDEARAARLILGWVSDDPRLLFGLTRPHLSGIVAWAVSRAARRKSEPEAEPPPEQPSFDSLPGDAFGKELLKAVAFGKPAKFSQEAFAPQVKKPGASQRHIDAIRRIAAASKTLPRKPDDGS